MIAKIVAAVVLNAVAANATLEVIESNPGKGKKDNGYGRFALKCLTMAVLTTAAASATISLFDKE